jgi:hypothetical protein
MHTAERVALWVIIALIVFFLFFKQTSGFTNRQMNLMSLAEFKGVPQPLKDAYVQNMSPIVDALSEKITKEWNGINPMDQQKALAQLAGMSQQIVANIKQAPNLAAAVNPGTHANVPAPPAMPVSVPAPQPMKI